MRLRQRSPGLPREAPPDPHVASSTREELLARLGAARLYVITPEVDSSRLVEIAAAAIRGSAEVIQLRHKTLARGELLAVARRLRAVTAGAGRLFVVNDHLDIALLSGADGVHLGPDDLSVESARRVAKDAILIGASASTPLAGAAAVAAGADYLGSGPAFATPIKAAKGVIGPAGIARVAAAVARVAAAVGRDVPVFAIGGIDESNVAQLTSIGVRRICVIRAIGGAADPEAATRRLRAMLEA